MAPGRTCLPAASIVRDASSGVHGATMAAIRSPAIATSALIRPEAETSVPPVMARSYCVTSSRILLSGGGPSAASRSSARPSRARPVEAHDLGVGRALANEDLATHDVALEPLHDQRVDDGLVVGIRGVVRRPGLDDEPLGA